MHDAAPIKHCVSLQPHHHGCVMDAFTSAMSMVFRLALTFATFVSVVMVGRFIGPIFFTFFKSFSFRFTV